jgi:rubrerythrin
MTGDRRELLDFLAHSLELESEAEERYAELAGAMAAHNNREVAEFFQRMAREAGLHREEVAELARGEELPALAPWEFRWPEPEAPESASYEAVHYRMGLREAIALALANEREAHRYYQNVADTAADEETSAVASTFAAEELQHAAALERLLGETPPTPRFSREEDDEPTLPE